MQAQTTLKKRRKYDADFKAEVLKMIENGKLVAEISQSLGIGENLIYRWKSKKIKQRHYATADSSTESANLLAATNSSKKK
jgi:transposase